MLYDETEAMKYFNTESKNNFSYGFKINYSKCLMKCGRVLESLSILNEICKKYKTWNLKYLIGTNYLLIHNYKLACEFFEDSLLQNPLYPKTHLNLARCYEKIGDNDMMMLSLKKYKYFK